MIMNNYQKIIDRIFEQQESDCHWKSLPESDKRFKIYNHYTPTFRSTLWTLILLADLELDRNDTRVIKPLLDLQNQFFDERYNIYSLQDDHLPIPCLNGNMIYLDCYFNGELSEKSELAIDFFYKNQRFDDGEYVEAENEFCKNKSCYGKHTCYWGIVKLFKGLSFIPNEMRDYKINELLEKCINFVLIHNVCFSSRKPDKVMIKKIDKLTFPNMYKGDFLEILWLLKRESVHSPKMDNALKLLKSKQLESGKWELEQKVNNLATSIGAINKPNQFITKRAQEVLEYYNE